MKFLLSLLFVAFMATHTTAYAFGVATGGAPMVSGVHPGSSRNTSAVVSDPLNRGCTLDIFAKDPEGKPHYTCSDEPPFVIPSWMTFVAGILAMIALLVFFRWWDKRPLPDDFDASEH